jgi:hypothetical protein
MAPRLTRLFTWGYWGWGTATRQFVRAVDAVEAARGFRPPMFVDIRISRSVRAPGFNGTAFERRFGADRYLWMPELGNRAILEGGRQRIVNPSAAADLLELARQLARERRRVIFFCACTSPARCHRRTVAGLVLRAGNRAKHDVEIVEWPGGIPRTDVEVRGSAARVMTGESRWIRVGRRADVAEVAGIPWYSVATLPTQGSYAAVRRIFIGPGMLDRRRGWLLPRLEDVPKGLTVGDVRRLAARRRLSAGFAARRT